MRYNKTVYDALFVAAADDFDLQAVTSDEPLQFAVKDDFPRVVLLRDWQPR
jgi:predicted nucleic acid-binding protein